MRSTLRRALGATMLSVGIGLAAVATAHAEPGTPDPSAVVPGLGMTVEQFNAAGSLASQVSTIKAELAGDPNFGWVAYRDGALVIIGDGAAVNQVAASHGVAVDPTAFNPVAGNATAMKSLLESEGVTGVTAVLETPHGLVVGAKTPGGPGTKGRSAEAIARNLKKVKVVEQSTAKALAATGGQGYTLNNQWICSLGFPGWNAQGSRILVSAGHCSGGRLGWSTAYRGSPLGTVTYSIFGDATSGDRTWGTDFLTVGNIPANVETQPSVDHYDGTFGLITGTASPAVGMPVCKSGQTTRWTCGTIEAIGWVQVDADGKSRYVYSALSNANGSQGDSGGAWVTGNKAVGVTSSGGMTQAGPRTNAAILDNFLERQPGSEIAISLPQPSIDGAISSATWLAGTTVTGSLPTQPGDSWDSSKVNVVVKIDGTVVATVPVSSKGTFQFPYNGAPGQHTVTVQATSGRSTGPVRTITVTTNAPQVLTNSLYRPVTPARLLDTRTSTRLAAGGTVEVTVPGANGVPSTGAVAAVLNLTTTNVSAPGYVVAYPAGATRPGTSSVNLAPGATVANGGTVRLGTDGKVTIANVSPQPIDLVVDLNGYYVQSSATGGSFVSLTPARFADTREGAGAAGPVPGYGIIKLDVTRNSGIPSGTIPSAVLVNLTVTGSSQAGHLTAWSGATQRPNVSNVNFVAGEDRANMAVVPVNPADGTISIYNGSAGSSSIIADIAGYYTAGSATQPGAFTVATPQRILETRPSYGGTAPLGAGKSVVIKVTGREGIGDNVAGVVMNVTATGPQAVGYGTVYPTDQTVPDTSTVNFAAGATVPNLAVVPTASGSVTLLNGSVGSTDYLADLQGWFLG